MFKAILRMPVFSTKTQLVLPRRIEKKTLQFVFTSSSTVYEMQTCLKFEVYITNWIVKGIMFAHEMSIAQIVWLYTR